MNDSTDYVKHTPLANKKKPGSLSLLSQLSDDLLLDVTAKAKNLTSMAANIQKKRISSLLSDEGSDYLKSSKFIQYLTIF